MQWSGVCQKWRSTGSCMYDMTQSPSIRFLLSKMATPSLLSVSLQSFRLDGIHDTGITVGDGAYATVLQYDFRGLKCVGKRIHRLLYENAPPTQRAGMLRRFEEECELLGQLHHPNIVQFLGVHVETGSELPVLVMEYLHTNLSGYLDRHGVLPTEISYGILRDVALGLRYLHECSPPIVHRDLSANNVLLTLSLSAKISDLGVSKILNIMPSQMTQQMSTKAPGTPCYMPPEALMTQPRYTRKIDSYSFGVMILHVLCGEWPFPSNAFQHDPQNSNALIPVTEVDRRAQFLQRIGIDHPLSKLVRQCLSNSPGGRPESADILQHINTALSQVPAPAETVLQQLEDLTSENQRLTAENRNLVNKNQRLGSYLQRLRARKESLGIENERLRNENQTLSIRFQVQPSIPVATGNQPHPKPVWERCYGGWNLGGKRDVILIVSNGEAAGRNADTVPQFPNEMTEEDRTMLISQGLSPNALTDNVSILLARVRLDNELQMVDIMDSDSHGSELSRSYVLERLESYLKRKERAKPGVIIYYIGHGKRYTGDWCFKDGFITFKDIAELYDRTSRHQALTIITDCSHSGAWVDACLEFLDEQGVRPCGHSVKERGLLLKVFASCRPEEKSATNCFFVRAATNARNSGTLSNYISKQLRPSQQTYGLDTTVVRCDSSIEEECTLPPNYYWRRWSESKRIELFKGSDHGRPTWQYVLLDNNPEKLSRFKTLTQGDQTGRNRINIVDYGHILKSGRGSDPPKKVKDKIDRKYFIF